MHNFLLLLLKDLEGIRQDQHHHPEGDALFHSLQVFEKASQETSDGELLAAALFHDIGKAAGPANHADTGADDLEGVLPVRSVWLVRHHMDLLRTPRRTRRKFRDHPYLPDLARLRRWDIAGRDPRALVVSPEEAVAVVLTRLNLPQTGGLAALHHEKDDSR